LREASDDITYSIKKVATLTDIKLSDACKLFGVSRDWFYRHRNSKTCSQSLLKKCFKTHPNQLTQSEVHTIESVIHQSDNFGKTKTSLYFDSIRKGMITCGKSTFFKYADILGFKKFKKKFQKRKEGFKAQFSFQWLHVDVTHIQTQKDGVQYVAFVKDNFSKALLGYSSTNQRPNSGFIKNLFQETFNKHQLLKQNKDIHILSDGGSENKGSFLDWINSIQAPPVVEKLTAKTEAFPFSNSMAESTHSIYKSEFMQSRFSKNQEEHLQDLKQFVDYYNNERYPSDFHGLTPTEVLQGQKPDKTMFREQIKTRKKERLEENRNFNNCPLICI
jgi:ACT domain-containing protein